LLRKPLFIISLTPINFAQNVKEAKNVKNAKKCQKGQKMSKRPKAPKAPKPKLAQEGYSKAA
jgi:hypothetical protein